MLPPSPKAYGGGGPHELAGTWVLTVIGTSVVACRTYVAFALVKRAGWDLIWAIIAWFLNTAAQVAFTISVAYGMGNYLDRLDANDYYQAGLWTFICQCLQLTATQFGRIAITAFILHIQGTTHRFGRYFLHFVWFSCAAFALAQLVTISLLCSPIQKLWYPPTPGICNGIPPENSKILGYVQSTWGVLGDLVLAIYPIFIFWPMQMSWQRKAGLCVLMGGGLACAGVAILKTASLGLDQRDEDYTYSTGTFILRSSVEIWFIIILGSVPQIYPLFLLYYRKAKTHLGSYTKSGRAAPDVPNDSYEAATNKSYEMKIQSFNNRKKGRVSTIGNESEEDILSPSQVRSIVVKHDYDVYSHREDDRFDAA